MSYLTFINSADLTRIYWADSTVIPLEEPHFVPGTRAVGDLGFYQYCSNASTAIPLNTVVKITPTLVAASGTITLGGAGYTPAYYDYRIVALPTSTTVPADVGVCDTAAYDSTNAFPLGSTYKAYGWVNTGPGLCKPLLLINCTQDLPLYTCSTAGSLTSTAANQKILGLKLVTSITTAAAAWCSASEYLRTNV